MNGSDDELIDLLLNTLDSLRRELLGLTVRAVFFEPQEHAQAAGQQAQQHKR